MQVMSIALAAYLAGLCVSLDDLHVPFHVVLHKGLNGKNGRGSNCLEIQIPQALVLLRGDVTRKDGFLTYKPG